MELAQSCKSFCHDLSETWLFELLQAGLKGQRECVPQIQKNGARLRNDEKQLLTFGEHLLEYQGLRSRRCYRARDRVLPLRLPDLGGFLPALRQEGSRYLSIDGFREQVALP